MAVLGVLIGIALAGGTAAGLAWHLIVGRSQTAVHGPAHAAARIIERKLRAHQRLAFFLRRRTSPAEITGLALTLVFGALVVLGALTYLVRVDSAVVRADRSVAQWAGEEATEASTRVLEVVTDIGGTPFVILVTIVVALAEVRRTSARGVMLFLLVVVAGQVALTNLVKVVVGRDRPDFERLVGAGGFSFPSGHAATAAACFAACALCLGRGRSRRVHLVLAAGATALALMVATSRVLLGVHWLSDAVAGFVFGSAWFAICAIAFGGRLLRFGAPIEVAERVDAARGSHDAVAGEPPGPWSPFA